MEVKIRRAAPQDAAGLSLVGRATFLETYAGLLHGADIIAHCQREHAPERYAAWLDDPSSMLWIVEGLAGAPVGYAVTGSPDLPIPTRGGDLELKRLYLLSKLQARGLGALLMEQVLQGADGAGAGRLLVGVSAANSRAIAFYTRQGFAKVGVRQFRVGEGLYDDLVLARSLS